MIYSPKIKINNNEHLSKNFYTNFNNIAIMISGVDHKSGRWKNIVETVFSPERSVTPESSSSPPLSSQMKQSKSLVISILTTPLAIDKLACIFLAPPSVNATVFEPVIPLQYQ